MQRDFTGAIAVYIHSVVSHLGGWQILHREYGTHLQEIEAALRLFQLPPKPGHGCMERSFAEHLVPQGWEPDVQAGKRRMDFARAGVGLDLRLFGMPAVMERVLFVNVPVIIRAGKAKIAVVMLPMRDVSNQLAERPGSFEDLRETLRELNPLPQPYPFVVVGFADVEPAAVEVLELTSQLDLFLLDAIGMTLEEALDLQERPNYDFKEQLPDNRAVAEQACGLANLPGGGVLLVGVADDGQLPGIDRSELDEMQLRVAQIINTTVTPTPLFELMPHAVPGKENRFILAIRVFEIEEKPCMTHHRVYVRSGPSVRPATPSEVRRMVLKGL